MPIDGFSIKSKLRSYRVHFVEDMLFLKNISAPTVCIVDNNVWDCHSARCLSVLKGLNVLLLEVNEEQKNLQTVQNLYRKIVKLNAKKNLTIVSIGGGITQDITGFVCSTLYRGIKWIFIPTTLLAQADSCIGSKTSLNFDNFKNLIGTFYPPTDVYIHTPFIKTQKKDEYFSGLGEVVKLHLIGGRITTNILIKNLSVITDQCNTILSEVIFNSLMIKKEFIEDDELDNGRRNMLNYGHCIGHALESVSDYKIPHGQAVIVGMILANIIARNRKLLSEETESILAMQLLFPILSINASDMIFDDFLLIEAMKMDKKRIDMGIPIVMLTDNFRMQKFNDLSEQEIIFSVNEFRGKLWI